MSTQPEALRLVEVSPYLENSERGAWIIDVKAELRRLVAENAELREANETFGRRQVWWNDRMFALEAQRDALLERADTLQRWYDQQLDRLAAVEAQRDALLETLRLALSSHGVMLMSDPPQEAWKVWGVEEKARAAIKMAEEE